MLESALRPSQGTSLVFSPIIGVRVFLDCFFSLLFQLAPAIPTPALHIH